MKKFLFFFIIGIMSFASITNAQRYDPNSIQRATEKVLREGILFPDPTVITVFYDEFFQLPDTVSSTGKWNLFHARNDSQTLAIDTTGNYFQGRNVSRSGADGGLLRMAYTGILTEPLYTMNLQANQGFYYSASDVNKEMTFEIDIALNDSSNIGCSVGLFSLDADSVCNNQTLAGIYYEKPYGSNHWWFKTKRITAGKDSTVRMMDNTVMANQDTGFVNFKFVVMDTNYVVPYINGKLDSAITTHLPYGSYLVPTIELKGIDSLWVKRVIATKEN